MKRMNSTSNNFITELLNDVYSILKSSENLKIKMACLDFIAGIYFLSPSCFDEISENTEIFRNPLKRLSYLIKVPLQIKTNKKILNFYFDSYNVVQKRNENLNVTFPFFWLERIENEWEVKTLQGDTISVYRINGSSIEYIKHGHTSEMQIDTILDLTREALEKLRNLI